MIRGFLLPKRCRHLDELNQVSPIITKQMMFFVGYQSGQGFKASFLINL